MRKLAMERVSIKGLRAMRHEFSLSKAVTSIFGGRFGRWRYLSALACFVVQVMDLYFTFVAWFQTINWSIRRGTQTFVNDRQKHFLTADNKK